MNTKLLLICGQSGAGKSTIARRLAKLDGRFVPVPVVTSRKMRAGEEKTKEKKFVSVDTIRQMYKNGELLNLDCPYNIAGELYGIEQSAVDDLIDQGKFPMLDYPAYKIGEMKKRYPVFAVILVTSNIEKWLLRLQDGRDTTGMRSQLGLKELKEVLSYRKDADALIINHEGDLSSITGKIYKKYYNAVFL